MKLSKEFVDGTAQECSKNLEEGLREVEAVIEKVRRDQPLTVGRMEDLLKKMNAEAEPGAQDAPEETKKKKKSNAGRPPKIPRSYMAEAGYAIETINAVYDYLKAQFQAIEQDPDIKDEDKKPEYLNILMAAYDARVWGIDDKDPSKGKSPSITQLAEDFKQISYSEYNSMYCRGKKNKKIYRGDTYQAVKEHLKSLLR